MVMLSKQSHPEFVLLHLLSSLVTWEEIMSLPRSIVELYDLHWNPLFLICDVNSWKDEFLIVSCCGEYVGRVANSNSTFHLSEKPQETLGSLALRNSWCFFSGTSAPKRSSMVSPISKLMPCIRSMTTVDIWIMVLDEDFIDPCVLAIWLTGRPTPIAVFAFSSS